MEIFMAAVLLGLIPAVIASKKGYSFLLWWVFGIFLLIIALPIVLIIGPNKGVMRKCPRCLEWVRREASACKYCGGEMNKAKSELIGDGPV